MIILTFKLFFKEIYFFDMLLFFFLNIIIMNTLLSFFVKNPIYSLLFLIANYIIAGFLFLSNNFIFLGLIFMLIYVGAISILFLFTFMLIDLKIIFYNKTNNNFLNFFFLTIILFEFLYFFVYLKNYKEFIINFENNFYVNWFDIVSIKDDLNSISYELYFKNSILIFISSLFLLMALIASVNIVNSLKNSKKQSAFMQLKNYTKNFSS